MSAVNMVIGLFVMIFCVFLAQAAPLFFTSLTGQMMELLKISLLFLGFVALFVGAVTDK